MEGFSGAFQGKEKEKEKERFFPFVWKVASRDFLGGPAVKPGLPMQGAPWPETKIPSAVETLSPGTAVTEPVCHN